jgi:2-oxoglutarate dehydrogenase E1 component
VKDIALGMAHRGRLSVLSHVMAKPHRAIFHEFKGGSASPDEVDGSGDVKYHLGASSDREFDNNKVHLSLTANPSHLEIVNPVVLGKTRAKQDQLGATPEDRTCAMPLLISGSASAYRGCADTAPAARCISSSTTRSVSRPIRVTAGRHPIRQMWPR